MHHNASGLREGPHILVKAALLVFGKLKGMTGRLRGQGRAVLARRPAATQFSEAGDRHLRLPRTPPDRLPLLGRAVDANLLREVHEAFRFIRNTPRGRSRHRQRASAKAPRRPGSRGAAVPALREPAPPSPPGAAAMGTGRLRSSLWTSDRRGSTAGCIRSSTSPPHSPPSRCPPNRHRSSTRSDPSPWFPSVSPPSSHLRPVPQHPSFYIRTRIPSILRSVQPYGPSHPRPNRDLLSPSHTAQKSRAPINTQPQLSLTRPSVNNEKCAAPPNSGDAH